MTGSWWLVMFLAVLYLSETTSLEPTKRPGRENKMLCLDMNNQSYTCKSGYCCVESRCCNYYHQLWWFWLAWTIIIVMSCFCICQHRRTTLRLQQQRRQHEINLIAYREVHNYASPPFYLRFLPDYLLPAYEEVVGQPVTPPPPYSARLPRPSITDCTDELLPPLLTSQHMGQDLAPHRVSEGEPLHQAADDPDDHSKDGIAGRQRHFTGDSGIEVCGCGQDNTPMESLELCHSCQPCDPGDEEQILESRSLSGALHPIGEWVQPPQASSTEPQS